MSEQEQEPINDGGPAFAGCGPFGDGGMTLRDYFAGQALSGLCGNAEHTDALDDSIAGKRGMAEHAYGLADAMLRERACD